MAHTHHSPASSSPARHAPTLDHINSHRLRSQPMSRLCLCLFHLPFLLSLVPPSIPTSLHVFISLLTWWCGPFSNRGYLQLGLSAISGKPSRLHFRHRRRRTAGNAARPVRRSGYTQLSNLHTRLRTALAGLRSIPNPHGLSVHSFKTAQKLAVSTHSPPNLVTWVSTTRGFFDNPMQLQER